MMSLAWFRRWTSERLSGRRDAAKRQRRRISWQIEVLEDRLLLTAYTPAQISQAYGVNQIMFGAVKGDGTGQTIAIVDAYHAPNISKDLAAFNAAFGLPNTDGKGAPVLTVATPQGTPAYNKSWAQESTLDVEWAHAIAPGAHILLVEAKSNSLTDLLAAVDYARNQPGVSVVSMSWGSTEFSTESAYDFYFTTPSGHADVSFIASAGDTAAVSSWPAVSPNVVAVGGTTLTTADTLGTYGAETVWSSSGGGVSIYETKPSYQSTVTLSSTKRSSPDVAYDANPSTGVKVYFTDAATGSSAWYVFGGTSIGAPQWAGIVAIANQGRALAGKGTLDGKSELLPALYNVASTDFHDITSGSTTNGTKTYTAGVGYDLVTGRGTPYANRVVADLLAIVDTSTTTTGSTSSGGTTKGGKGRPKSQGPHFDAAGFAAMTYFAFGDDSDVAGLLPVDLPAVADNFHAPSTADLAGRFGTLLVSPNGAPAWSRPDWQSDEPSSIASSQVADAGTNGGSGHASHAETNGTPAWSRSSDRWTWSQADRSTKGSTSSLADGTTVGEWVPTELVDAYFISLAQGVDWLPDLQAA